MNLIRTEHIGFLTVEIYEDEDIPITQLGHYKAMVKADELINMHGLGTRNYNTEIIKMLVESLRILTDEL